MDTQMDANEVSPVLQDEFFLWSVVGKNTHANWRNFFCHFNYIVCRILCAPVVSENSYREFGGMSIIGINKQTTNEHMGLAFPS